VLKTAFGTYSQSVSGAPYIESQAPFGHITEAEVSVPTTAVTTATNLFTLSKHGFNDTNPVIYDAVSTPVITGLSDDATYYIRDATTDTFKLAATSGGSALGLTGQGNNSQLLKSGSGASRIYTGDQMISNPCLIKRIYFWNRNDGPVNCYLHDGYGTGVKIGNLPKSLVYKVGQQSQLQIDVPEPGFIMTKGVFFRHGNKSLNSTANVFCTLVYEDLPPSIQGKFPEQGETIAANDSS